ncbi:MAG: glycosyltransferase, partial [Vicinamibacteria bacterium]
AVKRRLKAGSYDIVHAHWVVPSAVLARGPADTAGKPLVISLHGSDVFAAERSRLVGSAARRTFESARSVTACSSDLRDRAIKLGAHPGTTRTVPYGVDAAFFGAGMPSPPARDLAMRQRLGASSDQTLIVAVGRLVEKKGFAHLIYALSGASHLHLAIIGDGDLEQDLRARLNASGASVTLAGRFSRDEIKDALHCADIAAVPSVVDSKGNVDGLPNSLLEAMAAAKAIVASRVAGIPDVVTDGVEGLLVPPGDSKALRQAIESLAVDPMRRALLGRAAADRVARELTWERVASTLEDCYVQAQALAKR